MCFYFIFMLKRIQVLLHQRKRSEFHQLHASDQKLKFGGDILLSSVGLSLSTTVLGKPETHICFSSWYNTLRNIIGAEWTAFIPLRKKVRSCHNYLSLRVIRSMVREQKEKHACLLDRPPSHTLERRSLSNVTWGSPAWYTTLSVTFFNMCSSSSCLSFHCLSAELGSRKVVFLVTFCNTGLQICQDETYGFVFQFCFWATVSTMSMHAVYASCLL